MAWMYRSPGRAARGARNSLVFCGCAVQWLAWWWAVRPPGTADARKLVVRTLKQRLALLLLTLCVSSPSILFAQAVIGAI